MFSKLGSYMSGIIQHIVTTDFKNQVYSFCPILQVIGMCRLAI